MRPSAFRTGDEIVSDAVRRAWLRYLADTRAALPSEYEQVEERAWLRLVRSHEAVGERVPPARADYGDVYVAVSE